MFMQMCNNKNNTMEKNQHVIKNEIGRYILRIDCDTRNKSILIAAFSLLKILTMLSLTHEASIYFRLSLAFEIQQSRTFAHRDIEWKFTTVRCSHLNEHTIGIKCPSTRDAQ